MEPVIFHITEELHLSFSRLQFARSMPRVSMILIGTALTLVMLAFLVGDPGAAKGVGGGALLGGFGVLLLTRFVLLPRYSRNHYRQFALFREEITLTLGEDAFEMDQSSGRVRMEWTNIQRWIENDELIAVYPSSALAYLFPKSALREEGSIFVRERLSHAALPKEGKKRK